MEIAWELVGAIRGHLVKQASVVEQIRLLQGLVVHQILQVLELGVLLKKLDLCLLVAVDTDAELEKVDAFSPLDHLVVEFNAQERPIIVYSTTASARLFSR